MAEAPDKKAMLEAALEMAPLPKTASRLNGILTRSNWTMDEVVKTVKFDAPLTGRLLAAANSAAMASRSKIDTVEQAVMRLGGKQVVSIGMSASVKGEVDRPIPAYGLSEGQMWRHSIATALAAEQLAEQGGESPTDAYLAGLLHDVGLLVFARNAPDEALNAMREGREAGKEINAVETKAVGISHAELGEQVLKGWEFSKQICKAIRYHHAPETGAAAGFGNLGYCVFVADWVADSIEADVGPRLSNDKREKAARGIFKMPRSGFKALCEKVKANLDEVLRWYE